MPSYAIPVSALNNTVVVEALEQKCTHLLQRLMQLFFLLPNKKKGEEKGRIFAQPSSDLADNDIVAGLSSLRTVFDRHLM